MILHARRFSPRRRAKWELPLVSHWGTWCRKVAPQGHILNVLMWRWVQRKWRKEREGEREARGCGHFQPSPSHSRSISSPEHLHLLLVLSVLLMASPQPHLALASPWWGGHSQTVGSFVESQELDSTSHIPIAKSRPEPPSARTCLPPLLIVFSQVPFGPSQRTGYPYLQIRKLFGFCSFLSLYLFVFPKHLFLQNLKIDKEKHVI